MLGNQVWATFYLYLFVHRNANFCEDCQTVAEISRFCGFKDGGRRAEQMHVTTGITFHELEKWTTDRNKIANDSRFVQIR